MEEGTQTGTTRRKFLQWLIGAVALINGLILGIPIIGTLIGSSKRKEETPWIRVTSLGPLPEGRPVNVRFQAQAEDAFLRSAVLHTVWIVKHSSVQATVFSPICPHLGCYYLWNQQTGHFECPCHASVFTLDGRVLGGPAPRPLDTLPAKIEKGILFVQWERFRVGIPEKVRA